MDSVTDRTGDGSLDVIRIEENKLRSHVDGVVRESVEQTLNGLQLGLMLFLLSAGLTLVFGIMDLINPQFLVNSLVFSLLGVIVFWVSFIIIDKITPYDLWKEIVEKQNLALAIVVAAMCLGIGMIVAASVH